MFESRMGSHMAQNMTIVIMKILRKYRIEHFINCITTDNVSANDGIFKKLEVELMSWSLHDV